MRKTLTIDLYFLTYPFFQITMHLSPYEQQALIPWIKTFPKKAVARVPVYLWPVGTLAFIYGIMASTEMRDQAEDLEHRF
jgi:hypothetical protein